MFGLDESHASDPDPDPGMAFPLTLEIVVDVPEPEDVDRAVMEESLQEFRMVPASMEAIDSQTLLKKIKLTVTDTKEQCNICMEEFDDGLEEVTAMPCNHVLHQQCIVQWLQTSYTCPLCRHPMPTANN